MAVTHQALLHRHKQSSIWTLLIYWSNDRGFNQNSKISSHNIVQMVISVLLIRKIEKIPSNRALL